MVFTWYHSNTPSRFRVKCVQTASCSAFARIIFVFLMHKWHTTEIICRYERIQKSSFSTTQFDRSYMCCCLVGIRYYQLVTLYRYLPSTMYVGPNIVMAATGYVWIIFFFVEFGVMCCMLSTFHLSSQIITNVSEPSFLISEWLFRPCWGIILS